MIPHWFPLIITTTEKIADLAPQTAESAVGDTMLAVVLLVVAVILLVLEIVVVSYGLLAIAALGFAIAGIALGFAASPVIGWILFCVTPIVAVAVVAWGFRRLQRSPLVPKAEITEDAGYRHETNQLGITIGSCGTLVTDAMPTGRARFEHGEIDVQMIGPAAMKGDAIIVRRIEGPTVFVVHQTVNPNPPSPTEKLHHDRLS
jgi:membrane-bound ClpP family serine protease